jgi:hypothetical protein
LLLFGAYLASNLASSSAAERDFPVDPCLPSWPSPPRLARKRFAEGAI